MSYMQISDISTISINNQSNGTINNATQIEAVKTQQIDFSLDYILICVSLCILYFAFFLILLFAKKTIIQRFELYNPEVE